MGKQASDYTMRTVVLVRMLAILLSTTLASCSKVSTDGSSEATRTSSVKPLYANSVTRHFSNEEQKDTFNVAVNGESIITGEVDLRITNYEGKRIFSTIFPARALLDHDGLINPKKDEKIIKNRIDHFFETTQFDTPIAAKPDSSKNNDSTEAVRRMMALDPKSICFSYKSTKDSVSQIVYSKRLQKVVVLRSFMD